MKSVQNLEFESPTKPSLPKTSIVTPCFNHSDYIEATIRSVLDQDYPNLEYVIIDGGSSDESAEIIAKYTDRLKYWHSQPDQGQYYAINEGFQHTTGEIMGWLNSDDMLHRNALWTVAEIFRQNPEIEWLSGLRTVYDSRGRTVAVREYRQWTRYHFLMREFTWIQQESTFWRRSLWDKAGGNLNTGYRYAADFDLWMRFFQHAPLYTAPVLVGGFRRTPGQISERLRDRYMQEAEKILTTQPLSHDDKTRLIKLKLFKRLVLNIPLLGRSRKLRRMYERLLQCPPVLQYSHEQNEFHLVS